MVKKGMERESKMKTTNNNNTNKNSNIFNLYSIIKPNTSTQKIINHAIIQASAGKLVLVGNSSHLFSFSYNNKKLQWVVSTPFESYPRFFNSTDKAAYFFVKSWIKDRLIY